MPRGGDKIPSILEMMWNKPRDFMVKKSGEKTSIEQGDKEIPFVPELSYMWEEKANGNISGTKTSMHWFFPYILRSTGERETSLRSRRGGKNLDFEFIGSFSLLVLSLFLIGFSVNLRLESLNREGS
ncbi:hypothetical protein F2Q69_00006632 [Brassica cretica]|uniref:Uncharacterized protein n=1 Tax=Brassica cretica TaxID=69181 RepID=A0A8S9PAW5_BRACR|nr:hypothetical protein F2Q69_00006632 [Brassica cretica]